MAINEAMLNLVAFATQGTIIAAIAGIGLWAVRVGSPEVRYACWRLVLTICLLSPWLLQSTVAVPLTPTPEYVGHFATVETEPGSGVQTPLPPTRVQPGQPVPWDWIAAVIIVSGIVVRAGWLAVGLLRLRRLRRRGEAVHDPVYVEIQQILGTRAAIQSVRDLTQPATFGIWRQVVLIPRTLSESPTSLRRAVVTHELLHVQRRDWFWVLGEEVLRTLFWFHPAIFWITSRIQLTREEVVDELSVLATGNRKAYIEALVAFADGGQVRPAAAFARRRHLFTRIVRLSKEGVVSSPRIVMSAAFVLVAVVSTSWYASKAFPVVAAATALPAATPAARQTSPPVPPTPSDWHWNEYLRDTQESLRVIAAQGPRGGGAPRPGPAPAASQISGTKLITPENPIPRRLSAVAALYPAQLRGSGIAAVVRLQVTLDASGSVADVRRVGSELRGGDTVDPSVRASAIEAFFSSATDAVRRWRYQPPADPPIAFYVTVRWDSEDTAVSQQSVESPDSGGRTGGPGLLAAADAMRDRLVLGEGRLQYLRAMREDSARQFGEQDARTLELNKQIQEMERELERARNLYANSLRLQQASSVVAREELAKIAGPATSGATGLRFAAPGTINREPVRVGGTVKPPARLRNVNPEYPPVAMQARVQGVVILDVVIDEQGRIAEARVLRSIPLLDQAALDAVRQWEYAPTIVDGAPVPVKMTVTVNFTLAPDPQ